MGYCFSCCRRRDKSSHSERKPLLSTPSHSTSARQPPNNIYEKFADVFAAIHTGKLPSQEQANRLLQKVLRSEILSEAGTSGLDKTLERDRKKLVGDLREVAEAILQFGLEKNVDNLIQEILYYSRRFTDKPAQMGMDAEMDPNVSDELNTLASAIPSEAEAKTDISALITSVRSLASLVLTSSTCRLLLSDVLVTAREYVADVVEDVGQAAAVVEIVAEKVEAGVRPGLERAEEGSVRKPAVASNKRNVTTKEAIVTRLEEVVRQAQANPTYNNSLRTLLYLLRKYAYRVRIASSALSNVSASVSIDGIPLSVEPPIVIPDPFFLRILADVKTLLERLACGRPLDPLLAQLSKTTNDIFAAPASSKSVAQTEGTVASEYFNDVGTWLDRALSTSEPTYAMSDDGKRDAEVLYERGRELLTSDTGVSESIRALLAEIDIFVCALRSDRATNRLVIALDTLSTDLRLTTGDAVYFTARESRHWRADLLKLILGWLLPRLLKAVKAVPMPRVEYVDTGVGLEVAVDAMWLGLGAEVLPDMVRIAESSEVQVDIDGPLAQNSDSLLDSGGGDTNTTVKSISRLSTHIEGLRLAAYDIGYYARYVYNGNRWLAYADEGLLSVVIGKRESKGDGLKVDVEVELDTNTSSSGENVNDEVPLLFHPTLVNIDIPGLTFSISHSRHWILNGIAQPLLGPIVRRIAKNVLEGWVKSALEVVESKIRDVVKKVEEEQGKKGNAVAGASAEDWWRAAVGVLGSGGKDMDEEEEEEEEVYTETQTTASFKGVVHTTYTQPEPEPALRPSHVSASSPSPPTPTETTIAIGLGAQVLPGKGEPSRLPGIVDSSPPGTTPATVARQAIDEVHQGVKEAGEHIGEGVERAVEVREEVEAADKRRMGREIIEKRRKGWRSRAFDL